MIYTDLTKKALNISYYVHQGQIDKGGCPYVFHPFHIAEQMETEDEICTALLHDVLEDSDLDADELRRFGFPDTVIEAIILLTREKGCSYPDYIRKVRQNPLSRKIKYADLKHNLDLSRLDDITDMDLDNHYRYQQALDLLLE